jgi:DNA-binding PadR family transcriptional regulator
MIELGVVDLVTLATLPYAERRCWMTTRAVERKCDDLSGEIARSLARLRAHGLVAGDGGTPRRYARTSAGERVLEEVRR